MIDDTINIFGNSPFKVYPPSKDNPSLNNRITFKILFTTKIVLIFFTKDDNCFYKKLKIKNCLIQ